MVRKCPEKVTSKCESYLISEMEMKLEIAVTVILPLDLT